MRFAAIDLLVGAAKRAEPLEGLDQPEGETRLLAPRALAYDAIRAALGQRSRSVSYGFIAQAPGVLSAGSRGSSLDHLACQPEVGLALDRAWELPPIDVVIHI